MIKQTGKGREKKKTQRTDERAAGLYPQKSQRDVTLITQTWETAGVTTTERWEHGISISISLCVYIYEHIRSCALLYISQ